MLLLFLLFLLSLIDIAWTIFPRFCLLPMRWYIMNKKLYRFVLIHTIYNFLVKCFKQYWNRYKKKKKSDTFKLTFYFLFDMVPRELNTRFMFGGHRFAIKNLYLTLTHAHIMWLRVFQRWAGWRTQLQVCRYVRVALPGIVLTITKLDLTSNKIKKPWLTTVWFLYRFTI